MKSVRERETFHETMKRFCGEIKRLVDSADIVCNEHGHTKDKDCVECPFNDNEGRFCVLEGIVLTLGVRK
jgi:hypothetical protein